MLDICTLYTCRLVFDKALTGYKRNLHVMKVVLFIHGVLGGIFMAFPSNEYSLNEPDCGRAEPTKRIVNGKLAEEEQFPWMMFLKVTFPGPCTKRIACGATIITRQHLLSAAHCTQDEGQDAVRIQAYYGETYYPKGTIIEVSMFLRHPEFDAESFTNDISLMLLAQPLRFSSRALSICLPTQPMDLVDQEVIIAGWGYEVLDGKISKQLRYTNVKVVPSSRCRSVFSSGTFVKKLMICAYQMDTDACQGDSGGPMMLRDPDDAHYIQVGIVSFGIGCAMRDVPGVYTRLDSLVDWISENLDNFDEYGTRLEGEDDEDSVEDQLPSDYPSGRQADCT